LERFCDQIDTDTLLHRPNPERLQQLRTELREAFFELLFVERAALAAATDVTWPYTLLRVRVAKLEAWAVKAPDAVVRAQARLFLAMLPFPRQWLWLSQEIGRSPQAPEIPRLLKREQHKFKVKLSGKKPKQFQLRHCCQVLKAPQLPDAKGILRIYALPYLFANAALTKALSRSFFLWIEPPWGVVFRHAWCRVFTQLDDPCLFGMAAAEDRAFLEDQPGILTTALAHGDFLEDLPATQPTGGPAYDIVFNGSFDDMTPKRHALMLQLMQHPRLKTTRVLFLGRGAASALDRFKTMVQNAQLDARCHIVANIDRSEVPQHLANCRMGVHLSLHENGGRVVYEFFRSGLPCVMSACTTGVNPAIFNAQTGAIVPDADLADAIAEVLARRDRFTPRKWFAQHAGSTNATRRLNLHLKEIFKQLGYRWQGDIVPITGGGSFRYVDPADFERMQPAYRQLLTILKKHSDWPVSI
jgi:glycosyltransferase involved in cell wall biosynthesis